MNLDNMFSVCWVAAIPQKYCENLLSHVTTKLNTAYPKRMFLKNTDKESNKLQNVK